MTILVAIPFLPTLAPPLHRRMQALAERLVAANGRDIEVLVCDGSVTVAPDAPRYSAHAAARNRIVDGHLKPHHTHILWIDSDLVNYPADLPQQLLERAEGGIVAPLVLIEETQTLYDTYGFVEAGQRSRAYPPYFRQRGEVVRLDAVGCCYLAPAALYRSGVRYAPTLDHTEHYAVCQAARAQGLSVHAIRSIIVEHANLPRYGVAWN